MLLLGNLVLEGHQAVEVGKLLLPGHGVVHLGGGGAHPGGVDKGEQGVVAHLFKHLQGVLKLLSGLPGEAHDHVGGKHDVGDEGLQRPDLFQILLPGVAAVHHLQNAVVARLEGQVKHRGHLFAPGHGLKELLGGVLGVGGHKANEEVAGDVVDLRQQVGKVHGVVQVLAVGVYVLAQQGNVLVPLLHQLPHLGENVLGLPGALPAPDIGHDAVGAEVIAAVHDGHPGLHLVLAHHGDALGDGAGQVGGLEHPAPGGEQAVDKLRKAPQHLGAKDQVHMAVGFLDFLSHMGLLGHAAAQADELAGVAALHVDQRPQVTQHPLLGVLPDGAGVDDDDVGLLLVLGEAVAHLPKIAPDALGVGLILLAAVGVHKGEGGLGPLGIELGDGVTIIHLPGDLLPGNGGGITFHGVLHNKLFGLIIVLYHFLGVETRAEPQRSIYKLFVNLWEIPRNSQAEGPLCVAFSSGW